MYVPGRVTIAIPTFNRATFAVRALQSALAQSYSDLEIVVSDDASTDETAERVHQFCDSRLVCVRQPERLGLVANFDFCLRRATGEFFLLLGDDDVLLPYAIERLVQPLLQQPPGFDGQSIGAQPIGVAWCPCRIVAADGHLLWTTKAGPRTETPVDLLVELWAGRRGPRLSGILTRTQSVLAAGGFQQRYGYLCDLGAWGAAALMHPAVVCVNEPLVQYTNHSGSATSRSDVRTWQDWAALVHADLRTAAAARWGEAAGRRIARAKRNLIAGITLTILIQTARTRGWIRSALRELLRRPDVFVSRYMFRRVLHDGWKLLRLGQC